jgi:ssDNA-binding Zn-finger/Zn-ribbon topoisomerase 1
MAEVRLDIDYIESVVQQILDKAHNDPEKRVIKRYPTDSNPTKLNFACPICGDSHTKISMKRGHLHLKNLYYVCYNERETDSMFFSKFCKEFNVEIDMEKKMDIYKYLDANWTYTKKDDFAITNLDKLLDLEQFKNYITEHPTYLYSFKPITKGSSQWKYLADRKIFNQDNIWEGVYKITDNWFEPVIVILNRSGDKLLGMQLRNLKVEKIKRIYKFVDFQECYNMMHHEDPLDEIEAVSYNKISAIFNFFNVDYERPLHVFEGYLDSVFFPNSIALVGLDTDISIFSNEKVNMRFVLDNDEAGQRKAKQMIDQNHSVFLWKKLINHLSKGKGGKYKFHLEECKDINKLVEFYEDPNIYYKLDLEKFFAKDQFDLIDM